MDGPQNRTICARDQKCPSRKQALFQNLLTALVVVEDRYVGWKSITYGHWNYHFKSIEHIKYAGHVGLVLWESGSFTVRSMYRLLVTTMKTRKDWFEGRPASIYWMYTFIYWMVMYVARAEKSSRKRQLIHIPAPQSSAVFITPTVWIWNEIRRMQINQIMRWTGDAEHVAPDLR
jgi:hypothetical protein